MAHLPMLLTISKHRTFICHSQTVHYLVGLLLFAQLLAQCLANSSEVCEAVTLVQLSQHASYTADG